MQKPVFPHCQTNPQSDLPSAPFQSHFLLEPLWAQPLQNPLILLTSLEFIPLLAGSTWRTNTTMTGTDLSLRPPKKLILRQPKTGADLMDVGWVKSKPRPVWWQQMGAVSTACSQHTWVKPALQGDLPLRIRSKHTPPATAGYSILLDSVPPCWHVSTHRTIWFREV